MEEWRLIPNYSKYEVSSNGDVKNIAKNRLLKLFTNAYGYINVSLTGDNKVPKTQLAHRLVASAFLLDWASHLTVDHINRDRSDNRVCNLRMATRKEQLANQVPGKSGKRVPTQQYSLDGILLATYASLTEAAKALGVGATNISDTANGKRKAASGFMWKYIDSHDASDVWKECAPDVFISRHGKIKRKSSRGGAFRVTGADDISPNSPYPSIKMNKKMCLVHRLVAEHFLPPPEDPAKTTVNHIDGNKRNACADNLEWCTLSENSRHAHDTGLSKTKKAVVQFSEGQFVARHDSLTKAARHVGSHRSAIWACANGRLQTVAGFTWKYENV